ncbi:hypothetical protein HQ520_18690, partial [bacterium]|nr:hypothetical protein [bacterium]
MLCPFCRTMNRDERDTCYNCQKDLSMLRLIVNKAKLHFNNALELAERDRFDEAIVELNNALDLDHSHVDSQVVLGTLYAKTGDLEKAQSCWQEAPAVDPRLQKAHDYLGKAEMASSSLPILRRQRRTILFLVVLAAFFFTGAAVLFFHQPRHEMIAEAWNLAYTAHDYSGALALLEKTTRTSEDEITVRLANVAREILLTEQEMLTQGIHQNLDQDNLVRADELTQDLLDRNPAPVYEKEALAIQGRVRERMREQITDALENLIARRTDANQVTLTLESYRHLRGVSPDEPFLLESQNALTSVTRTLRVQDAIRDYEQRGDRWTFLDTLIDLREEYP